jgi:hypothetical protein
MKTQISNHNACEHNWEFQDDSFSHEFGIEVINYWLCNECGEAMAYGEHDEELMRAEDRHYEKDGW